MTLKNYQKKALEWLTRYYERCRELQEAHDSFPASTAFYSVTREIYGTGLSYSPVKQLPGIPYVCLRIPTGGGKTVVGCEAVAVAQRELLRADRLLVLWLVPSDAIRAQTLKRMQDRNDPYRVSLETKLGAVEVIDIEEALTIQRAVLDSNTVIVVATMQAFRRKDTSQLKVYENSGALMHHFENLPDGLRKVLEPDADGVIPYSLANVFRIRRPFVIVDEAHNNRQPLAFETLKRLNPSGILELTATPNTKAETVAYEGEKMENPPSNVLVSISAYALKAEHMIKLPIYLRYREPWDALLGDAIGTLNKLKEEAEKERAETGEYLRPIMLLQAQPEYKNKSSITVHEVKSRLLSFGIPEEEIAIATGDIRELEKPENLDILNPACRVRFIITVQALKEGWDCPFAYVLFSVAELSSGRPVEQILGRILRMPNARRKRREPLNSSYAFVASTRFADAARALADGLIAAGFERQDVDDLLVEPSLPLDDTPDTPPPSAPVTITLATPPCSPLPLSIVDAVTYDEHAKTLRIEKPLTDIQESDLVACFSDAATKAAVAAACDRRAGRIVQTRARPLSPSQRGEIFEIPFLALKHGDLFRAFEEDDLEERIEWSLSDADAELSEFFIPSETRGIRIDIDETERLQQEFIPNTDAQQRLLDVSAAWPVGHLVCWLDRSFAHDELTEAETGIYITRVLTKLIDERGFTPETLTAHRYRLAKALAEKFRTLRIAARRKALEQFLFTDASAPVYVTAAATHRFDPNKYPVTNRYRGLELPKHYYEVIDNMNNEEIECARVIAHHDGVHCWIRNIDQEPQSSFWIQTSTDKFYPDFVCELKGEKYLAVEYKGTHLDNSDTDEKERLGDLWAARSNGTCHFLMIRGPSEISRIADTVAKVTRDV